MEVTNSGIHSIADCRKDFPSLKRMHNGFTIAYFDGPAGTQMPEKVVDAMVHYYHTANANTHGQFATSIETDKMIENTRKLASDFLGAGSYREISFGANMTTLNYSLSSAIGKYFNRGDEILITQLDHEANRGPWMRLRDNGLVVREVLLNPNGTLNYNDFQKKINESTRLVAMGHASNALGTVNDLALVRELTYKVGAWLLVDAVHYAPHFPIHAKEWGVDFLLCSAYKFYGPHVGILYTRQGLLDRLPIDCLITQEQQAPYKIETGTLNHAALAGLKAALEYISSFGSGFDLRTRLVSAMERIADYEHQLAKTVYDALCDIPNVQIFGPSFNTSQRAPTIAFILKDKSPMEICAALDEKGINTWDGHFYAIRPIEVLGLLAKGGVVRIGISIYNTADEILRLLKEIKKIANGIQR